MDSRISTLARSGFRERPGPPRTRADWKTIGPRRRSLRNESGSTMLEMALCCAVLFMLLFGIMQFSLAVYSYHFVSEAAREGSRYAIVRGSACSTNTPLQTNCGATSAQIQTYVRALGYLSASRVTVTTTWLTATSSGTPATTTWSACASGTCNAPGNLAQVAVTYAFPLSIPFWSSTTINLTSTSRMVISQ